MLVDIGFKEIEVGYPAANDTEFEFVRCLIENDLIPDDVTIQVLTMSREQAIRRTFEAHGGRKARDRAPVYRHQPRVSRNGAAQIARGAARPRAGRGGVHPRDGRAEREGVRFEFSPEHFTATETDFALEVCNRVLAEWQPTRQRGRRSSTCRRRWSFRCRTCTRGRWNICTRTWRAGKMWF